MTFAMDRADIWASKVESQCESYGATVYLLEDDGEELQVSLEDLPKSRRPKGMLVNTSDPVYRRFFGEAEQIERGAILLLLPGSAREEVTDDVRLRINGETYRTNGPILNYNVEGDEPRDILGKCVVFIVPISRF